LRALRVCTKQGNDLQRASQRLGVSLSNLSKWRKDHVPVYEKAADPGKRETRKEGCGRKSVFTDISRSLYQAFRVTRSSGDKVFHKYKYRVKD
jgi:hypothetical protein